MNSTSSSEDVVREAARAESRFGTLRSTHEALGVLLEEFDELKDAIHRNSREDIRKEAIQVAAVALRLANACASSPPDSDFSTRSGF